MVPSTTATLCEGGLQDQIVGCTNFCVEPANLHRTSKIVGGTKDPDIDKILELKPDIVFMNEEENRKDDYTALQESLQIHLSFPKSADDVVAMLRDFHGLFSEESFLNMASDLEESLKKRSRESAGTALYFIWKQPYMLAGKGTFIDHMLSLFGFENMAPEDAPYPEISLTDFKGKAPQYVLLSSEPYPFRQRDTKEISEMFPQSKILKIDGKLMSWHGVHTVRALRQFEDWKLGRRQDLLKEFSLPL